MKRLLAITLLSACISKPVEVPLSEKPVEHKEDVTRAIESQSIEAIENANSCKDTVFGNRGKPFTGFLVGMAKSYIQTRCNAELFSDLTKAPVSSKDAYVRYGLKPTLPNIYAFMVGLAAQESSFKHCEGRDMTAGWSESHEAESGLFQTSLNSTGAADYYSKGAGKKLYNFFKSWNKQGFIEDFSKIPKENKQCTSSDAKTWGKGADGIKFQQMSKALPAFQVEYTALLLKYTYLHHGPIVRREVLFKKPCLELFETLDKSISCP